MKNKLTAIGSIVIMAAMAQTASANGGKIDFEGAVTDSTCEVTVNGQTNNATVKLPNVSSTLLKKDGDRAGRTFLNFELSNCSLANGVTQASVYFLAGNTVNTKGRLDNMNPATDKAKNVDIEILDVNQKPLDISMGKAIPTAVPPVPGQGATAVTIDVDSNNVQIGTVFIRHYAQYYATAQATAGPVSSSVEYTLDYE